MNVYCVRCNGTGMTVRPGVGDAPCGLCKGGVIGFIAEADVVALLQKVLSEMGVQLQRGQFSGM